LRTLASQAFPGKSSYILAAFDDAMEEKYAHLCMDFSPNTDEIMRVTSGWFRNMEKFAEIISYVHKGDTKVNYNNMAEDLFSKLVIIPFSKFEKLTDEYNAKSSCAHSNSNNKSSSNINFQVLPVENQSSSRHIGSISGTPSGGTWGRKEEEHSTYTSPPPQTLIPRVQNTEDVAQSQAYYNGETELVSTDSSPHLGRSSNHAIPSTTRDPNIFPIAPPPPPPPNLSLDTGIDSGGREVGFHEELQEALAVRGGREKTHQINRPTPTPLSIRDDPRAALLSELRSEVERRRAGREELQMEEGKVGESNTSISSAPPHPLPIAHSIPPTVALPPLSTRGSLQSTIPPVGSSISHLPPHLPPALEYTGWGAESHTPPSYPASAPPMPPRTLEYFPTAGTKGPARAIENMQNQSLPDSFYPNALRRIDPDLQPPLPGKTVKKSVKRLNNGRKGVKGRVSGKEIFSPSSPIKDNLSQQSNSLTTPNSRQGKKRPATHLSRPRPTLPKKRLKSNRGEKRGSNFQEKPPKRNKTDFDLWTFR
jgi:hypothetical protein